MVDNINEKLKPRDSSEPQQIVPIWRTLGYMGKIQLCKEAVLGSSFGLCEHRKTLRGRNLTVVVTIIPLAVVSY